MVSMVPTPRPLRGVPTAPSPVGATGRGGATMEPVRPVVGRQYRSPGHGSPVKSGPKIRKWPGQFIVLTPFFQTLPFDLTSDSGPRPSIRSCDQNADVATGRALSAINRRSQVRGLFSRSEFINEFIDPTSMLAARAGLASWRLAREKSAPWRLAPERLVVRQFEIGRG